MPSNFTSGPTPRGRAKAFELTKRQVRLTRYAVVHLMALVSCSLQTDSVRSIIHLRTIYSNSSRSRPLLFCDSCTWVPLPGDCITCPVFSKCAHSSERFLTRNSLGLVTQDKTLTLHYHVVYMVSCRIS